MSTTRCAVLLRRSGWLRNKPALSQMTPASRLASDARPIADPAIGIVDNATIERSVHVAQELITPPIPIAAGAHQRAGLSCLKVQEPAASSGCQVTYLTGTVRSGDRSSGAQCRRQAISLRKNRMHPTALSRCNARRKRTRTGACRTITQSHCWRRWSAAAGCPDNMPSTTNCLPVCHFESDNSGKRAST